MNPKTLATVALVLASVTTALSLALGQDEAKTKDVSPLPYVDAKGNISRPEDVRATWAHLGSWSVGDGTVHDVYTQPESVKAYRKDGKFPDGAVLVKEVRKKSEGFKTTGKVEWSGHEMIQWFVMVKDSKMRFADNPLWGHGWGWGLFKPDAPMKQVSTSYQTDCMGCHIPAAATDRVYLEGYPTLKLPTFKAAEEAAPDK